MFGFQRAGLVVGCWFVAFACGGQKFGGVDATTAGSGGSSSAGTESDSGSSNGGDGAAASGGETGGKAAGGKAAGGGGVTSGGHGGVVSVAGAAGRAGGGAGGNGGSGGAVVEPSPIPLDGLQLWFDAAVGVTNVNGSASGWKDRSSFHRDALQTAGNYRPKLVDNAIAAKPALVFDGVDDVLNLPALDVDFGAGVSMFAVVQQTGKVEACQGYFEASNGPELDDIHLGEWQHSLLFEVEENWVNDVAYPLTLDAPQVVAAVLDANQVAHVRSNSNGAGQADVAFPPQAVRKLVYLGSSEYTDCTGFEGAIGEFILYNRGVTDPELVQIESYLQKKWACCVQ